MRGYYYLMSSLPVLDYTVDPNTLFTEEQFLDNIRLFVPPKDYELIRCVLNDEFVSCSFVVKYEKLKKQVDSLLAFTRAKRLGIDAEKYRSAIEFDSSVRDMVEKAVACENPLDAEMLIYSAYWKCLDEIVGMHKFDLVELAVYALRLKLLKRKERFDEKKGREEFDMLYSSLHVVLED